MLRPAIGPILRGLPRWVWKDKNQTLGGVAWPAEFYDATLGNESSCRHPIVS